MDTRTIVRELDEVMARTRSATDRELKLIRALPACTLRRRKERLVAKMRSHLQRLQSLRTSVVNSRRGRRLG
jgi:hypothetical protein